jgi:DNA-directed RNA polymerase alpha subunit
MSDSTSLLDINALLVDASPESNKRRQLRADHLWSKSKEAVKAGDAALADRLKTAGNQLVFRNHQRAERAERAVSTSVDNRRQIFTFNDRGLSEGTVHALVDAGIDAPERLLFATETEVRKIPGIGEASLDEIMRYRARFLDVPPA